MAALCALVEMVFGEMTVQIIRVRVSSDLSSSFGILTPSFPFSLLCQGFALPMETPQAYATLSRAATPREGRDELQNRQMVSFKP
jgi:hypothetical protein